MNQPVLAMPANQLARSVSMPLMIALFAALGVSSLEESALIHAQRDITLLKLVHVSSAIPPALGARALKILCAASVCRVSI